MRESIVHRTFIRALNDLADQYGRDSDIGDLADFAAHVLDDCGHTEQLAQYLDQRALRALEHD